MVLNARPVTRGCVSASIPCRLSPCGPRSRSSFGNSSVARRLNPWRFWMAIIWWPSMAPGISPPRRFTVRRACKRSTATDRSRIITRCWAPQSSIPIVVQDGTKKNDCERNAAKRFITKLRQDHPHLKVIITEDALSSNAPHIETLHDYGCHYILGVKEGDHAYLFKRVQAAEEAGGVTYYERHDRAAGIG